jgi:hypothetical protein
VGPLPAATYWRRRAGLAAVLVVLLLVLRSCGGEDPDSVRTADPSPSASASATPSATPTASSAPAAAPACTDAEITATVAPSSEVSPSSFVVTVTNRSQRACRRDLGPGVVDLVVTSGADRVWARSDCDERTAKELATLAPGGSRGVRVAWDGRRSLPDCEGSRAAAAPGTYRVAGKVGSKPVAPVVFRVR